MERVLQVVDSMDMGGIQTFIMNVYRHIDRKSIQFDFLVFKSHKQIFEDEIVKLGGKIYKLPGRRKGLIKNYKAIKVFFDNHKEYRIIHYNTSGLSDIGALKEAARRGIPVRIIHSHSTKAPGNKIHRYIHQYNKKRISQYATEYLACGDLAADWFYKDTPAEKDVVLINNGIDCDMYSFSNSNRKLYREKMGLENKFVMGHIGRFVEVKNHKFLVELFLEFCKNHEELNPHLLLVGDGPLKVEIEEYVQKMNISNLVTFTGNRSDIPQLLQAMDCMILPSIYEGFPVTAVEAQAVGLPCFISDSVTSTVAIKKNVHMISLEESFDIWINAIYSDRERISENDCLKKAGFDIQTTIDKLIHIYGLKKGENSCN